MNLPATPWPEARVRQLLADEDLSYQRVELPHGLATPGDDRSGTARLILPDDLRGQSFLDVGCEIGYFCFEAARRGAQRVVGLDLDADTVRKARLLAECLGLTNVEFRHFDLERDPLDEPFDHVICLNVLHHLKNPIAAMEKLTAATRRRLSLELVGFGKHDRKKLGGLSWLASRLLGRYPILYAGRTGISGRYYSPKFVLTPAAVGNILTWHRNQFARIETLASPFKDRFLAVAHKRQVGHLVVLAGPAGAGKSHLLNALRSGEHASIAAAIGLNDPGAGAWPKIEARRLHQLDEPRLERLVLHYNFLSPFYRSARSYERDEALDLLDAAERLTFVTVWAPSQVLLQRFDQAKAGAMVDGEYLSRSRHADIKASYQNPAAVKMFYQRWFEYVRKRGAAHHIISTHDGVKLIDEQHL